MTTVVARSAEADCVPEIEELKSVLVELLDRGGPRPDEYPIVDGTVHAAWEAHEAAWGAVGPNPAHPDILDLQASFPVGFLRETVHGHGLAKPMGYAGDFLMIARIYVEDVSPLEPYRRWDEYFHRHDAPCAVRARKDYFKRVLNQAHTPTSGVLRVLNVGTGPGRDLAEYLRSAPDADIHVT